MKALLGISATQSMTVTFTGSPTETNSPLWYASRSGGTPLTWTETMPSGSTWTRSLAAGDYVFRLEDDDCDGSVTIDVDKECILVTLTDDGKETLVAGTWDPQDTVETSNPKDPWPPPPPPPPPVLTQTQTEWFDAVLLPYATVARSADAVAHAAAR